MNPSHDEKFKEFNKLIAESKESGTEKVIIHHPEVLGDNYEELVENLNRLSDAELGLFIVPRNQRSKPDEPDPQNN